MASDDKKTSPAPKNETVVKKEAAAEKKDEGQPKDKSTSDADLYHAVHRRLRLPDFRAGGDSPLTTSFHQAYMRTRLSRGSFAGV